MKNFIHYESKITVIFLVLIVRKNISERKTYHMIGTLQNPNGIILNCQSIQKNNLLFIFFNKHFKD